jgi:hypothetical protein
MDLTEIGHQVRDWIYLVEGGAQWGGLLWFETMALQNARKLLRCSCTVQT